MNRTNPPTREEFEAAAVRLQGVAVRTPLVALHTFAEPANILLKLETLQPVTSFKVRGVYNAVARLDADVRRGGVSTVSAGNMAQALSWVARRFQVSARSLMPDTAPQVKIDAVRRYGGMPVLVPMEEVFAYLRERRWEREPYAFVHPWTDRDVMIGHGTLALEVLADCPEVDSVFVPVGGGGLLGGVGSAIKAIRPEVRVVAVEPQRCAALHASLRAGAPTQVTCHTLCDGVAVPYITEEMFPLLRELVDEVVLVCESSVRRAVRQLALDNKLVAEPSGALALAAAQMQDPDRRGTSVCLITGGSIDAATLAAMLEETP